MRQRHLPTLGLSWSHLPTLGPDIWTGSCGNGIFQVSVCGKQLQYCKKGRNCNYYDRSSIAERQRETAITTTAPVLQIGRNCNCNDRSNIAERETAITTAEQVLQRDETAITTTAPVLQIGRNCNYFDRSGIAEKENLQLLRPLQYCRERERNCTY